MKKWQIAISILLVFALGTAAGAYGSRVLFKKRVSMALRTEGSPGIRVIQTMMDRLDLSEDQRASINAIVNENNEKWETLRQEYAPKIKELYEAIIEETKKELTDQQREEIENMSAKVQRRLPPRSASPPRSSSPPDASGPEPKTQPFGPEPDPDRVSGIMEQLQIEKGKSAEVQSIIEADLQRHQQLMDDFEKAQAAVEKKFNKDMATTQAATEQKLEGLLTPEQMETYRQIMNPEDPRPDDFSFDVPGDTMQPRDFNQGAPSARPEGKPGRSQGARSL